MKQEYRYAKGWRIFLWIFIPILIVGFGYLGVMPYIDDFDLTAKIFLTILSVGLEFVMILAIIDLLKGKLILEKDEISLVGVFKTRTLKFMEIKGFKKDSNYLYFIPVNKNLKQIKVSAYMGKFSNLVNWADQNFTNLDLQELIKEKEDILTNEDFGGTVEEREKLLKKAKKVTKIINIISWISALSLWFVPYFYNVQVIICAALPIIGFVIYKQFKGIIKIDDKPNSAHPNLITTFFIPACALMLRALMDYNVFNYDNFWKPVIPIFASLAFLMIKDSHIKYEFKKVMTYFEILGMLMFGGMYAYGFIINTNSVFDTSQPEYYKAKILDKRISSGKSTSYYFELSKWGPQEKNDEVRVNHSLYDEKEVGDSALIYFSQGLYKIPYFIVIQ